VHAVKKQTAKTWGMIFLNMALFAKNESTILSSK
jgi:hypothetical protein